MLGLTLAAAACQAEDASDTDAGLGAPGGNGGGQGGNTGPAGGNTGPVGGTIGPVGGSTGPVGGSTGPVGGGNGQGGAVGGTTPTGGAQATPDGGVPPAGFDVTGDAELMGLVTASEGACRGSCTVYGQCGELDTEADPPETVESCQASCSYVDADFVDMAAASSRDALATLLRTREAVDRCVSGLNCEDLTHFFVEDIDPYPCQDEWLAFVDAYDAAYPEGGGEEFACADGSDSIPVDWVCDTEADCPDASDEANCE